MKSGGVGVSTGVAERVKKRGKKSCGGDEREERERNVGHGREN